MKMCVTLIIIKINESLSDHCLEILVVGQDTEIRGRGGAGNGKWVPLFRRRRKLATGYARKHYQ